MRSINFPALALILLLLGSIPKFSSACSLKRCELPQDFTRNGGRDIQFYELLKSTEVGLIFLGDDGPDSLALLQTFDFLHEELNSSGSNMKIFTFFPGKDDEDLSDIKDRVMVGFDLLPDPYGKVARTFSKAVGYHELPWWAIVRSEGLVAVGTGNVSLDDLRQNVNQFVDKPIVKAMCPVCGMMIVVGDKTPSYKYKDMHYYFCPPEDHQGIREDLKFIENPERYLVNSQTVPTNVPSAQSVVLGPIKRQTDKKFP